MTDESAFLATIIANPDDDAPRLVYADWMEERGDEDGVARAEFIRVQCELAANHPAHCNHKALTGQSCRWCSLRRRERELLTALGYGSSPRYYPSSAKNDYDYCGCKLRRGFVHSVNCEWAFWQSHAAAIMGDTPLREVFLTTLPASGFYQTKDGVVFEVRDSADFGRFIEAEYGIKFTLPNSISANWATNTVDIRTNLRQAHERILRETGGVVQPFITPR